MKVKVRNMVSPRTGRPVANQFIIEVNGVVYFQSYETIIAKKEKGEITIDENYWDYSKTTLKYLKEFLRDECRLMVWNKKDIEKLIRDGIIKLDDLN